MTEKELYWSLYSKVVRDADKLLQEITKTLTSQNCGWKELHDFYKKLQQVLLDAEEMYVSAEDVEEDGLEYINDQGIESLGDCVQATFRTVCADMADCEKLAQKVREKFEEDMRKWKEELRESEEGDYFGESSSDGMYKAAPAEGLTYDEEFHREMLKKREKKMGEQEEKLQDAGDKKTENQET